MDAGGHIIGTITNEPRIRTLTSGSTVTNFTVTALPRHYDHEAEEWRETKPVKIRCNAWHGMAGHVHQSLHRGDRVIVVGRLKNNDYTDPVTGLEKSYVELDVDTIGPDLRYVDVEVLTTP